MRGQYGTYPTVVRGRGIEIKKINDDHCEGGHTGKGVKLPGGHIRFFLTTTILQNKNKGELLPTHIDHLKRRCPRMISNS